jgi:hypothetical protein
MTKYETNELLRSKLTRYQNGMILKKGTFS